MRKEKGVTQKELAAKLGIRDRAISKWENGRGLPDYDYIQDLCQELDITFNEFITPSFLGPTFYPHLKVFKILSDITYKSKKNDE